MSESKKQIKVVIADKLIRESVLIDPSVGAGGDSEEMNNVIAEGAVPTRALLKKVYDR